MTLDRGHIILIFPLTWFEIRRVPAVGINRRRKSNSIKDLLVKIAKREHLEISEGDTTPFSIYASAWLERKKAILARSTYGDYRSIWKKYVLPYFGNMPLCRVTRLDVEEFLGNLPDISAKRKNNIMVPLKCLFNDASRRGEIDEPPPRTSAASRKKSRSSIPSPSGK